MLHRQHLYKCKNKIEQGIKETEEIQSVGHKHLIVNDSSNGFVAGEMVNLDFIN